jgi:uncharacterized protein YhaN
MKKTIEQRQKECATVNAALPANSIETIVENLTKKGHDWANYSFVFRTLNGHFKKWMDEKHGEVISEAKRIIRKAANSIK